MTNYTVRIELHRADDDDYNALHEAMEQNGFVRWVETEESIKYRLPTAEYNLSNSELTRSQVLDLAVDIAKSVKPQPTPWILVTQSAWRRWSGIKTWSD